MLSPKSGVIHTFNCFSSINCYAQYLHFPAKSVQWYHRPDDQVILTDEFECELVVSKLQHFGFSHPHIASMTITVFIALIAVE